MWPFKTIIIGGPVHINCGHQSSEFRRDRAESRVANLNAKLTRFESRKQTRKVKQEIANTLTAITAWNDVLEIATLELEQESRRSMS